MSGSTTTWLSERPFSLMESRSFEGIMLGLWAFLNNYGFLSIKGKTADIGSDAFHSYQILELGCLISTILSGFSPSNNQSDGLLMIYLRMRLRSRSLRMMCS